MSKNGNGGDRIVIASTPLEVVPDFEEAWRERLGEEDDFLVERVWSFTDKRRTETASVIGRLISTHLGRYSELQDVSCAMIDLGEVMNDPDINTTQLALVIPKDTEFLSPNWVAWNIVELVNEQLNVIKSPYELDDRFPSA